MKVQAQLPVYVITRAPPDVARFVRVTLDADTVIFATRTRHSSHSCSSDRLRVAGPAPSSR